MKFPLARSTLSPLLALPIAFAAGLYFFHVPNHPPGFSIDESSICYNAWTISQTGRDEYGQSWPLFFRAFGEYKSPTIIYLLAGLFKLGGPSIATARFLTASIGVLAALLLGTLALKITRRRLVEAIVTAAALFTPWLFESSRLVFEVALYPALIALFLCAVWNAHQRPRWTWRDLLALAVTLALLTYSYSIGRLLGPMLALGLGLFFARNRWLDIAKTWVLYALLCVPLLLFHRQNPEALTGRFKSLTYLRSDNSVITNLRGFAEHYFANLNPWRWLVTGENNIRDHVENTGSLLAATVLLAVLGLVVILCRHRRDPWWRFVLYSLLVSPIPASLTSNPFPQLRLIAFPVFFLLLMLPAIGWLMEPGARRAKGVALAIAVLLIVGQGLWFQRLYHAKAPGLWYVFDARFPRKVLNVALASERRPIYLLDEPGKSGYIQALWYSVLAHLDSASFVRLPWSTKPPSSSVVLSTEEDCQECRLMARALNYIVYSVPPYPPPENATTKALSAYRAEMVCENPPATLSTGQYRTLSFLVKNISTVEWPCVGNLDYGGAVLLQGRWLGEDGAVVSGTDTQMHLPYDVEPGDTVGLSLPVAAPRNPGRYNLEVDLVQKGVASFSERGSTPYKVMVEVVR
jgi:4-amino-4-deoxy-L-arabinose transferase-like glycosyltransferase